MRSRKNNFDFRIKVDPEHLPIRLTEIFTFYSILWGLLVMGDQLNFIIDHWLESVDAFDAILPIIIGLHIFTELGTFYSPEGNSGASVFSLCPCVRGNNWFSYITLGKTYRKSS